jgi:hypothetical protein
MSTETAPPENVDTEIPMWDGEPVASVVAERDALRAQLAAIEAGAGTRDPEPAPEAAFGVVSRDERIAALVSEIRALDVGSPVPEGRAIRDESLAHWFSYHAPQPGQLEKYAVLRAAGFHFAKVIRDLCPAGADVSVAIRYVREAVMTANASIACDGR